MLAVGTCLKEDVGGVCHREVMAVYDALRDGDFALPHSLPGGIKLCDLHPQLQLASRHITAFRTQNAHTFRKSMATSFKRVATWIFLHPYRVHSRQIRCCNPWVYNCYAIIVFLGNFYGLRK